MATIGLAGRAAEAGGGGRGARGRELEEGSLSAIVIASNRSAITALDCALLEYIPGETRAGAESCRRSKLYLMIPVRD